MADDPVVAIFDLYRHDAETEAETAIGRIEFSESGRLGVLEVHPEHDALVRRAIEVVNRKDQIVALTAPAEDDTTQTSVGSKVTERGTDEFFPALNHYLRTYFGLTLA